MKVVDTRNKKVFLSQIKEAINEKLQENEAKLVSGFVDQLFVGAFVEEFEGRRLSDVLGLVMSAWRFSSTYKDNAAKVAVLIQHLKSIIGNRPILCWLYFKRICRS